MEKRLRVLLLSNLFLTATYGQPLEVGFTGSSLAFNYNSSRENDGEYITGANQYVTFQNINIATLDAITIEMWAYWLGAVNGVSPDTYQNQTLFFMGTDANNYIWLTPCNGTLLNGPQLGFNANPILEFRVAVGGQVTVVPFRGIEYDGAWSHVAVSLRRSGISHFTASTYGVAGLNYNPRDVNISVPFEVLGTNLRIGSTGSPIFDAAIGVKKPYIGRVQELRIWSKYRNEAEINSTRYTSLSGYEDGLIHYWRFTEGAGNQVQDSVGGSEGIFSLDAPQWSSFPPGIYLPPPYIAERRIPYNGSTYIEIIAPDALQAARINTMPQAGALCRGQVNSTAECTAPNTPILSSGQVILPQTQRTLGVSYIATRNTCDTLQTFVINATDDVGKSGLINVNVAVGNYSVNVTGTYTMETEGGRLTLSGAFGPTGPLANGEAVRVVFPGNRVVTCTNVNIVGSTLMCDFPANVGTSGDIELVFCGKTFRYPDTFTFEAPTVTAATGITYTELIISGENFGPGRTFDNVLDYVKINGSLCDVFESNHTHISCYSATNLTEATYELEVSIGGQVANILTFDFAVCVPACVRGKCVSLNTCYCYGTGYEGPTCDQPLSCVPPCVEGNGFCVRVSGTDKGLVCTCFANWTGTTCERSIFDEEPSDDIPFEIIIGTIAGVVALVLILVVVIVVLAVKKGQRRVGRNFIPLEKKDFTKIIWGDQLNQAPEKTNSNLKTLEELLTEDNLEVALAISNMTQITDADKVAKAMIVVFQDCGKVMHLLEAFIAEEVRNSESAGTLFRSNSMVSKMFKFYSRLIGLPYLYVTIGPELDLLIEEELGLEVDPEKMVEGTDLDFMRWTLMAQSQKILKSILNSDNDCPTQFKQLFAHIKRCVLERFPENVNTTIGGFIFLRFFCPAVSSPEAYGIVEEPPSADARRLLILITKVLQNLSNDVEFGSKEPYMTKMNDFIQSNRSKLTVFYEKLVKPTTKPPVACDLPKSMKQVSMAVIANHIRDNLNKIENQAVRQKLEPIINN